SDNLNVRTEPNKDAEIVGHLHKGNQVTVFEEKYGWLQTYYDGQIGWVASHHLYQVSDGNEQAEQNQQEQQETQEQQESKASQEINIIDDAVHIRTGPDTGQTILEIVYKGDTYTLLDTKNDWHKVSLGNGNTAWVASWLTNQATTSKKPSTSYESSDYSVL